MVDFCLLSFILHEVKEPIKLLREAFRLLKNNGRVCVIEWKAELTPHGPTRNIRITREHLKELFNESGLTHFKYINWSTNHYVAIGEK